MITDLLDTHAGRGVEHTAREIAQQPALWREVGRTAAARQAETAAFLRPLLDRPDLRIVLTGAGTSAFAGKILAPALARELRRRVEAVPTTDIVSNPLECFAEDRPTLLVSFARSGDSPESLAATELAEQLLTDCYHVIVTCNAEGRLGRDHASADRSLVLVMPEQANDQGFAMTSSFTCMVLATYLTLGASGPDGALVERLAAAGDGALAQLEQPARALAAVGYQRVVYLGSGPLKGLARESSLKLLELTAGRVAAWFDSPLAFRHGPKSLLNERTLALVYLSGDAYTRAYDQDLVAELRAAMAPGSVVTITAEADDVDGDGTWAIGGLGGLPDVALALPFVLCAQLIGVHTAVSLGLAPDNPFPSGEVNRVVQGVTIHPLGT